jgi:hypothetical protein
VLNLLRDRFVPVAVDQHIHRHLRDAEGKLFASVLDQAGRGLGGYSQGVYLFTPSGKLLAFANIAEADPVKRLLRSALAKFDPESAKVETTGKAPAPLPEPPAGGLVVRVAAKVLGGYEGTDKQSQRHANSLGRDNLWLRKDEVAALSRGELPDSVSRRIARYHLIDNTRGEPPLWRDDEVRKLALTLKDGRLTGTVLLETKAGDRRYQANLLGFVEVKDGTVLRFDLLAKGSFHGQGTFTRGAPKEEFPFAVAFTLSDPKAAVDRIPPQGARGNLKSYLR